MCIRDSYTPGEYESPTFELSYEKIGDNKWRITVSNIEYEGYLSLIHI